MSQDRVVLHIDLRTFDISFLYKIKYTPNILKHGVTCWETSFSWNIQPIYISNIVKLSLIYLKSPDKQIYSSQTTGSAHVCRKTKTT